MLPKKRCGGVGWACADATASTPAMSAIANVNRLIMRSSCSAGLLDLPGDADGHGHVLLAGRDLYRWGCRGRGRRQVQFGEGALRPGARRCGRRPAHGEDDVGAVDTAAGG